MIRGIATFGFSSFRCEMNVNAKPKLLHKKTKRRRKKRTIIEEFFGGTAKKIQVRENPLKRERSEKRVTSRFMLYEPMSCVIDPVCFFITSIRVGNASFSDSMWVTMRIFSNSS